jgi:ketosteroid isomerase-like protein
MTDQATLSPQPTISSGRELYQGRIDGFAGKSADARQQEMIDREELRELTAIYAHRAAQGVSLADLFTDDGAMLFSYPGQPAAEARGRAALDAMFKDLASAEHRPLPMIHNNLVKIDGDEAEGICSIELRLTQNGQSMIGSGFYKDRMRRVNGTWKFVERDMHFIHMVPIQKGWADGPV